MVSTTLTTIVSASTGGTNNHHYQHQYHQSQPAGRSFYFSSSTGTVVATTAAGASTIATVSDPKTSSTAGSGSASTTGTSSKINATNAITTLTGLSPSTTNSSINLQTNNKNETPTTSNGITHNSYSGAGNSTSSSNNSSIGSGITKASLGITPTAGSSSSASAITATTTTIHFPSITNLSTSPPLSDQISILFPKCRPKNDVNLNPVQSSSNNINNSSITNNNNSSNNSNNNKSKTLSSSIPSSSSLSSAESLSSSVATPRISTNPFLNTSSSSNSDINRYSYYHHHHHHQTLSPSSPPPSSASSVLLTSSPIGSTTTTSTIIAATVPTSPELPGGDNISISSIKDIQQQHSNYNTISDMPRRRHNYHGSNQNPFLKENYWEARHNTTPASTVLNSPELTENESRSHFSQKQHIKVGRSPVSHPADPHDSSIDLDTPTRGVAVVANGEVVVFDDISESWQNLRVTSEQNPLTVGDVETGSSSSNTNINMGAVYKPAGNGGEIGTLLENNCDEDIKERKFLDRNFGISMDSRHRIMEYEGSPRRIGQSTPEEEHFVQIQQQQQQQHQSQKQQQFQQYHYQQQQTQNTKLTGTSSSIYTARPGFPQRIISTPPRECSPPTLLSVKQSNTEDTSNDVSEIGTTSDITPLEPPKSSTFDYLYEFSETRKVLEEFFKCPSSDEKPIENGSDVDSIDIQYEFHSSNLDNVEQQNNYVGQRLAGSPLENNYNRINHLYLQNGSNMTDGFSGNSIINGDEENGIEDDDNDDEDDHDNPCQNNYMNGITETSHEKDNNHDIDFFLDSASRSSGGEAIDNQDGVNQNRLQSRSFRYSPETTDYDSNCGDLDSLSGEFNGTTPYPNYAKYYAASMPVLEDGLSSGHASDTENNNSPATGISVLMDMTKRQPQPIIVSMAPPMPAIAAATSVITNPVPHIPESNNCFSSIENRKMVSSNDINTTFGKIESPTNSVKEEFNRDSIRPKREQREQISSLQSPNSNNKVFKNIDPDLDSLYSISVFHRNDMVQLTPPPPAPAPHRKPSLVFPSEQSSELPVTGNNIALKDMRTNTQRAKTITSTVATMNSTSERPASRHYAPPPPIPEKISTSPLVSSPVWIPRHLDPAQSCLLENDHQSKNLSCDEDDVDTDLETDRLLGHQRLDDQGFYDENKSWDRKPRSLLSSSLSKFSPKVLPQQQQQQQIKSSGTSLLRQGLNSLLPTTPEVPSTSSAASISSNILKNNVAPGHSPNSNTSNNSTTVTNNTNIATSKLLDIEESMSSPDHSDKSPSDNSPKTQNNYTNVNDSPDSNNSSKTKKDTEKKVKKNIVLIEGVLFRARYLGSTQLVCEGQPTKSTRMMQAEEAVSRIKAPDGEVQPSTEVDLFISTEKIMVLNTDLKEIMMDHALRTISYIADIGDLVVLMARRRFVPQDIDDGPKPNRTPKMICHVFESDEAQFIAQSIGQAFQVAYMEFLKANGIEDHSFVKEMDYQEVLNSQEIFGDELEIFAKKELQKEVVVPKAKGEILGVVIVESGWGSMLPTVVIANLMSSGAAARCGQLNIGDQLIAINGLSLVGLPLSTCQNYIKNTKNQTVVKFTVVPCAPVVEVKIKRPNTKYQLGFSVQNGVICSLLRGGIAERGGVRVGHRIIEINNQSVVAVPHEKIVNLLATSVGEILMKTMPTSMFRLLTGQENPIYI